MRFTNPVPGQKRLLFVLLAFMPIPAGLMLVTFASRSSSPLVQTAILAILVGQTLCFSFVAAGGLVWNQDRQKWLNLLLLLALGAPLSFVVALLEFVCIAILGLEA
jgi:hypothetical protein